MSRRPKVHGNSPWDAIQHVERLGHDDLIAVMTAGHGGIWIGPSLIGRFRQCFPEFQGYAGLPWLEEDCDAALAPLAFPELFTEEQRQRAEQLVRAMPDYHKSGNEFLNRQLATA